jgi:hypothetical protein
MVCQMVVDEKMNSITNAKTRFLYHWLLRKLNKANQSQVIFNPSAFSQMGVMKVSNVFTPPQIIMMSWTYVFLPVILGKIFTLKFLFQ